MNKRYLILLVIMGLIILSGIMTSCAGGGNATIPGTNAENTAELRTALENEQSRVIYLTGDVYDMTDLVIPSGKSLIGPNSPDYPAQLSKRGSCVLMPSPDATSGALIRINAFSDVVKDVKVSGVKFQLPEDYEWDNMHEFFMVFIQGNSEEASSTLSNITIENCTFDYTTAPDAPEGRDLSTGISVNTTEITKAENITIKNNTFLMKTSNTDCSFGAILINGTANDPEKGIIISENKIYGGLPNTGRAPFGIIIESPYTVGASSRQNDTLHVKLSNNSFYGKDVQNNVLFFLNLMSVNRNAFDIQLDMTENEFGTLAAPIVGNDKNNNIIWLGFNFDYPTGVIEFTANSMNNSFALKGDQFRSMIDTYFPEPNPYVIKVGSQSFTNTSQVSAALTTQQDYINIVDSVDVLGNCLSEDVPKVIYTLPGSYTDCCFDVPNNNVSVIGPLSPDYPAVLTQGEAAFTPAPDVTGFNILHFLNQGDPEVAEDFQRENIHFSGLTFTTPSATVLEHLITFFDIAVYYSGGGPSGVIRHDFPDWYLRDFSIDNCVFDFRETSPQNAGINCIVYCSEFCTFEDISISNNTFYVKNLESTYLDGEEAEKPCKIRILDGTCGSANPNKKIKINNNVFSGSEVGSAGTLPTYLTLYPDGGAYNTKEEFYYEIKGNHFVGNKEYNRIIQSHNIKKMNIDFSENTFGSVQTPYRNDVEWNGTAIFYFLEDNPITFTETQTKNNYYAATPDGTINMFYGVSVDEASINFLYGQQQKTGEELTESLINVIH